MTMRQTILEPAKLRLVAQGDGSKCKGSTDACVETQLHVGEAFQEHFPPLVTKQTKPMDGMADTTDSSADEQPAVASASTSEHVDTWASITGKQYDSLFTGTTSEHVSQVRLIFIAYKKVSWDGHHIPMSEVTSVVANAVKNVDWIDGIQAMRSGWNIYMKTEADRASLMVTGVNLAGKHVSLNTARCENLDTAKIIVKDLPLHKISNQEILIAIKEVFELLSKVKYSNVFVDGKKNHICTMVIASCMSLLTSWIRFQLL